MSDGIPRSDAIAVNQRCGGEEDDALDEYLARHGRHWVGIASRFLARLRIDKADLDGEGAVDLAFCELYRKRDRGCLISIDDSVGFQKQMTVILKRVVRDECKRSQAVKRAGEGLSDPTESGNPNQTATINRARRARHLRRTEVDPDSLPSTINTTEDLALVNDELEVLLARVEDPTLRAIITMRVDGYTRKEIAAHLGVTERTIQRRLAIIQRLYPDPPDES